MIQVRRGLIYFVDLNAPANRTIGHEQAGQRPVLVLSINLFADKLGLAVVIPGTDAANWKGTYQNAVLVPKSVSGLTLDTIFLCHQIRTLSVQRFTSPAVGWLPSRELEKIEAGIRFCLGLGI